MSINVTLNLPAGLVARLQREVPNLDADVTETCLLELFRRGQIGHHDLSVILRLDRFETDAYLNRHGIFEGLPTAAGIESDRETLARAMGGKC